MTGDIKTADGPLTRIVDVFMRGDVALLIILLSLALGGVALFLTPREEEPQIVVPMIDIFVSAPGLSAAEVERQVTNRLERVVYQIDGVEYVYSMSRPGESVVTVRFHVGEDREDSLLKLYNKIESNRDIVPPVVDRWVVKPLEVDDVPVAIVSLWSERPDRYGDHELRRIGEQLQFELKSLEGTNRVQVVGGRPRRVRVLLHPVRLAARGVAPLDVLESLTAANVNIHAGAFEQQNAEILIEAGQHFADVDELKGLVIREVQQRPVYLRDVADVLDAPAEVESYTWMALGPSDAKSLNDPHAQPAVHSQADEQGSLADPFRPAVHVAVAKQKGANAVWVTQRVQARMEELAKTHLPSGVHWRLTRDYGETADDKVNELVEGLVVAVLTVIGLIGLTLGWRAALVVALAIPVCYSLTLFINLLAGYSINRVTMFALILSLGLLVDDPITDVENIARYFATKVLPPRESVLQAISEVRPALILSTLAIIVSFLPLAFITGMMGPYMAPMALNVPLTVSISTVVAFLVTPWLSLVALRRIARRGSQSPLVEDVNPTSTPFFQFLEGLLGPLFRRRWRAAAAVAVVAGLLAVTTILPALRVVPLKMLPYDNKNEFQVLVDMPAGATLEETDAVTRRLARRLLRETQVRDVELFTGIASPMDFNGMVRHYFLRGGAHVGEIRVNLAPKEIRGSQSHEFLLGVRNDLQRIAQAAGARVKLVEVPPGPPVLATVTVEIYGPEDAAYGDLIQVAGVVQRRLAAEPGIVDVDISAKARRERHVFVTDKPKAALSGVTTANIARTMELALSGVRPTVLHSDREVDPTWIELRLPRENRSSLADLLELYVRGDDGAMVRLGSLGKFVEQPHDQTIQHKNLNRVVFVYGEVAGRPPADAIIDMQWDRQANAPLDPVTAPPPYDEGATRLAAATAAAAPRPAEDRTWLRPGGRVPWRVPEGFPIVFTGEGEWKITLDVFRDLGLAFAAALFGIFVILMFQTGSRILPLVIMMAIPLTLIGILPGFWLLNVIVDRPVGGYATPVFFTATAMIGMIALAGIVVRNSVVLIDFIHYGLESGMDLKTAIVSSVAIRTRPILLTAGTTLLGNWVITLDPIFSGLAWAIIFGIFASTVFTLLVIPLVYWLIYGGAGKSGTSS